MKWRLTIIGDESEVKDLERVIRILRKPKITLELESKYSPLEDFLVQKKEEGETSLELTTEEVQKIIQADLPPSAQKHDSFWRDRRQNIGANIVRAGWRVEAIQRDQENNQIEKISLRIASRRHKRGRRQHRESYDRDTEDK